MTQHRTIASKAFNLTLYWFAIAAFCLGAYAQRTVTEKNGVGGRIETDYNAAGKVTAIRTFAADGKLQQKSEYEYLPGYYVAQKTNTTYGPGGKPQRVAHNSYDASANFTGEVIEVFDNSGNQTGGHQLTHDPWTNTYRCAEWNTPAHAYQQVECPEGEEEGGGREPFKKFTQAEVLQHIAAARKAAKEDSTSWRVPPLNGSTQSAAAKKGELALVLPSQVRPGERVSGLIVDNPDLYDETAGLRTVRLTVPLTSEGDAAQLSTWLIEAPGEKPQPANAPITFVVPAANSELQLTFRQAQSPMRALSQAISLAQPGQDQAASAAGYLAPALCLKAQPCMVSGRFSGDSRQTFAAFADRPAKVLAESSTALYVVVPELSEPGPRALFISDGAKLVAFPTTVGEFFIKNNGRELQAGQQLILFPTLQGPESLPEWRSGNFSESNLALARKYVPNFEPRQTATTPEKQEPEEKNDPDRAARNKEDGQILIIVKNAKPDQVALRASTDDALVFHLTEESFQRGIFKYDLLAEAKKPGAVEIKGYVIPFLAPVAGQEFNAKPTHPR